LQTSGAEAQAQLAEIQRKLVDLEGRLKKDGIDADTLFHETGLRVRSTITTKLEDEEANNR
jgi:hypothetical protein